jgi:hypothetical protein
LVSSRKLIDPPSEPRLRDGQFLARNAVAARKRRNQRGCPYDGFSASIPQP